MSKHKIALAGILALAALLRLYKLTAISLWHDEAFSALLIKYPWHEMLYRIGLDVHPPLYYALLKLWGYVFGGSLLSLRGFSALFGILTVYAAYLLAKSAFNSKGLALAASLIIAVNPFQIQYVTEARMYTLGAFAILMNGYFLVEALKWQKKYFEFAGQNHRQNHIEHGSAKNTDGLLKNKLINRTWGNWFLYALFGSLCLYTHYYLFFSVMAMGLFALVWLFKNYDLKLKCYRYFFGAISIVIVSYIPWLPIFISQFKQVQENYWIPKINNWSIPLTNWRMLFGIGADTSKTSSDIILMLASFFSIYMVYMIIKQNHGFADASKNNANENNGYIKNFNDNKWIVILGLLVPFAGAMALSLKQSIFLDRYFLFAGLFYCLALAIFIWTLQWRRTAQLLLAALALVNIFNWAKYWHDLNINAKPGMAGAANFLNNNVESGPRSRVIIASSFALFNFKYYNRTGHIPLLYAPGIKTISDLPRYSGTALLDDKDLLNNLATTTRSGDTEWLLWTNGFAGTKPQVPADWKQVNEYGFEDVRPYPGTFIFVDEFTVNNN